MNPRIGLLLAALFTIIASHACDVCGSYLSLYPQDRMSFVSMLVKHRTMKGTVGAAEGPKHGGSELLEGDYLELYSTLEFRANFFLAQRVSLMAMIPTVNRYRSVNRKRKADTYGVGDPILLATYMLKDELDNSSGKGSRISVGGGVKLPLGRTDYAFDGELLDRDMQAGTGSLDPILSVSYFGRFTQWGLGAQWMGTLAGYTGDFRYGHNQNATIEAFYMVEGASQTLAPFVGMYAEQYGNEREKNRPVEDSSGKVLFTKAGARAWLGQWQIQAEAQYALAEEHASVVPPNKFRIVAGISYYLKTSKTQ